METTRLQPDYGNFSGQGGFSMGKVIFVIAVVGALLSMAGSLIPDVYDFYVLRDMADRVVGEYKGLSKKEVRKRVTFELDRSRIRSLKDKDIFAKRPRKPQPGQKLFLVKPTRKGYQVEIDYRVPLALEVGGKKFTIEGYEELELTYKVES